VPVTKDLVTEKGQKKVDISLVDESVKKKKNYKNTNLIFIVISQNQTKKQNKKTKQAYKTRFDGDKLKSYKVYNYLNTSDVTSRPF